MKIAACIFAVVVASMILVPVAEANAPQLTNPGTQQSMEGGKINLSIVATDPNNDPLVFTASGLPSGLTIDSSTGVISGFVPNGQTGSYLVNVIVDDGVHGSASVDFEWDIVTRALPAGTQFFSPIAAVAEHNRDNSNSLGRGAAQYTIDRSGFAYGAMHATSDPIDSYSSTFWYVWPTQQNLPAAKPAEHLYYDLGSELPVSEAYLWNHSDYDVGRPTGISIAYLPAGTVVASFDLPTLSAQAWTSQLTDVDIMTNRFSGQRFGFGESITTRYVRLTIESSVNGELGNAYGFNEFAVVAPIDPTNTAPVGTTIYQQINREGDPVSIVATGSDADGDQLHYFASDLPPGIAIDSNTGHLFGHVGNNVESAYVVNILMNDGRGGVGTMQFRWTIDAALNGTQPVLQSPTAAVAEHNRDDSDVSGRGASGYTIDGSGFSNSILGSVNPDDDFQSTFWYVSSANGVEAAPPEAIYYDLGSEKTISEVYMWLHDDEDIGLPRYIDVEFLTSGTTPATFDLATMASQPWQAGVSGGFVNEWFSKGQRFSFGGPVTTRYLKLTITGITEGVIPGTYGFNEFAVGLASLATAVNGPAPIPGRVDAYPNPFNPTTTLRLTLTENAKVAWQVFDVKGRLIFTAHDGNLVAGTHERLWNGRDNDGRSVVSGVYFQRVASSSFTRTTKLVLLK